MPVRRALGRRLLVGLLSGAILIIPFLSEGWAFEFKGVYTKLVDLIKLERRKEPVCPWGDLEESFDKNCHQANMDYFENHPALIKKIQADLGAEELTWRLDHFSHRLMFVPEERQGYARLFRSYCQDVIDYVMHETHLHNPYNGIQVPVQGHPYVGASAGGVTAYIVHNLAEESNATYIFSNKHGRTVNIKLRGLEFLGTIGSFTTKIYLKENSYSFVRDPFTIWCDSAANPYTALMTPVEETFHILLRPHTERAIREELQRGAVGDTKTAEKIVADWMAVEEGIVGGLVHALLPEFVEKYAALPATFIAKDLDSRSTLPKYRHLKKGIEIVKALGCQEALRVYSNNPREFARLLKAPIPALRSADHSIPAEPDRFPKG
jgi:hypothetical protein